MNQFRFQILEIGNSTSQEWLSYWAKRYDATANADDETVYRDLIQKHGSLSNDDFICIGKWKDGVRTPGQWKANVASVAYLVWMRAAEKMPKCPDESDVEEFLKIWSEEEYTDEFKSGSRQKKHFGPPRATTLLHFVSGGRYPIFDRRVRTAYARLLGSKSELPNDVKSYLDPYCKFFQDLGKQCQSPDARTLDKALFTYGASNEHTLLN